MPSLSTTAVVLAVLAIAPALQAQEARPPEPRSEVKPEPWKPALSGFFQLDYRLGDDAGQKSAVAHEFYVRRARLTAGGKVHERVSYALTTQLEGTNASVLEAFAEVTLKPLAKVRAGQYKYDFDLIGRESSAAMAFADRPFISNAAAGSLNGLSTASTATSSFRDRGLTLLGDSLDKRVNWGYSLGLLQGAGRASDNNDAFGYTANLRVYPVKALRLNAGFLSSNSLAKGAPGQNQYSAWTCGANYEHKRGNLRAEYYRARRDKGTTEEVLEGFYVRAIFSPVARLDLMTRYQQMEDGKFAPGSPTARSFDLGARWYFARKGPRAGTHLALNYMARSADDGFKEGLTLLNDGRGPALTDGNLVKGVLIARLQVQF